MKLKIIVVILSLFQITNFGCKPSTNSSDSTANQSVDSEPIAEEKAKIIVGAEWMDGYLELIEGKNIAVVVNQTSRIEETHLVDKLLEEGIKIAKIFAPEHGFRGEADAGETVKDGKDSKTGIDIISLYGKNKKPTQAQLNGIDYVVFDIQDVGARFYTYISTMTYVMDACAENGIPFLVLDRPNPNGHYVDGPVLKKEYASFVGLHEVPIVHGMTVGEYARMVNGEMWLESGKKCDLTVIPCQNYDHKTFYDLPVPPSPNLPNARAVALYPSLCLFEGTNVSVGRGTELQFQVIGAPDMLRGDYGFIPKPMPGAKNPKHEGVMCKGFDLTKKTVEEIRGEAKLNLGYLLYFFEAFPDQNDFFLKNKFFDKLAGGDDLRLMVLDGEYRWEDIRRSWDEDLEKFRPMRKKYLLYDDFE